ncbi:MAG: hypothetical protein U0235_19140 [Polyangiaceae bacterium]
MKGLLLIAAASAAFGLGCAKKAAPAATTAPQGATVVANPAPAAEAVPAPEKMPRVKDAAVYVDGRIVAFLKPYELPASVHAQRSSKNERPYGFASYLTAIGVDVSKVRQLHLHGGTIGGFTTIIPGDSLRVARDDIRFVFSADGKGRPRPDFNGRSRSTLGINTGVDTINAVAVYIEKEPPHENAEYGLSYPDGRKVDGMAYADAEAGAGTRVYVDGKLVSIVKRKSLSNDLLATGDLAKPEFSLAAYLKSVGVDPSKATVADFIDGDGPRARVPAARLQTLTFAVPARNQGLAVMALDGAPEEKITAIQLYRSQVAPKRETSPSPASVQKTHQG